LRRSRLSAARLYRHKSSPGYPQLKRLLIRPGAIGDCIVSLPALEHLKGEYTEVWTSGPNVPLIRFADRVRSISSTGIDFFPPRLEGMRPFDDVVSWYGTNRPEFREATSPYPVRFLDALPNAPGVHAIDFYMRQVGGADGAIPRIDVPREDHGFIAVHPYSGSPKKNWPYFAELIARLDRSVQVCVGPEQSWPGAVRYDDLYELAKWLATAALYIGNDSGITHLAAAVGIPVIAIFQASDLATWAPRGRAATLSLLQPEVDDVVACASERGTQSR
jgi:heptosyltransferase III